MLPKSLRGRLLVSIALGVLVAFGLIIYGDLPEMGRALGQFRWSYLAPILALTLFNYFVRFLKWDFYLRQIGVTGLGRGDSLLIWLSGLSMVITPGKVGEWLKSYLLAQKGTIAFSRSAPVVAAERLTDALGMVLLASAGFFLFGWGWQMAVVFVAVAVGIVALVRYRPLALKVLGVAERLPVISRRAAPLYEFYESSHTLLSPRNMLVATLLGAVSWFGECIAFYLVLLGLGQAASGLLVVQALFIFAVATLAGTLFLTPGGLGVAEGGITGLSQALLGMPRALAAASALVIRLCTLWFGLLVGTLALVVATRRLRVPASLAEVPPQ